MSVLPGAMCCDLVIPEGQREGVYFRGGSEALRAWIQAGPYNMDYKDGVTTVTDKKGIRASERDKDNENER